MGMYKHFILSTVAIFIIFSSMFFSLGFVFAEDPTPTPTPTSSPNISDLQSKINDLQNKINDAQKQGKTLSAQISAMDNQVKLTEFRIQATKQDIDDLTEDIETATKKISTLEASLDNLTKVLLNRVVATYQAGSVDPLQQFMLSDNASELFTRMNYLKVIQAHDKQLLYETQQTKNDYANQKTIFEDKKKKVESLKAQLEGYTKQLEQDKKAKQSLLAATKNSESEYQRKLAEALRELTQIQQAARVLALTESKRVGRGEIIGLMGNTGYSSGAHLHFGIYNLKSLSEYNYYSGYENPIGSLQSQNVDWDTGCGGDPKGTTSTGNGSFSWPMSTGDLHISQGFGVTCWAWMYKGNPHPAFDMYNKSDIFVRAVEEGDAYFCKNCTGDGANGVFIFHPNGKMSLYWHLQ